ncbi:MAG: class I SAM-dependent methyltransferase, partial [Hyphomicrobiales bacterium]|nr:class I SAM-dependent methyltransferase [Hyphomicrobiales bacterium]
MYWYVGKLNSTWPSITVRGKEFSVSSGVYKPLENEFACAEYCPEGVKVLDLDLDLGCGCGVGAVFCADKAKEVLASDISAAAVKNTRENCEKHGVDNVTVVESDMFANIDGKFDLIVANPPYIAADFEDDEKQFATSIRYLPLLFASVHDHLADNGLLLVQYPKWFQASLVKLASAHGMELQSAKRMPAKSPGLSLLSLLYMQVGFRSTFFLFVPKQ